MSIATSCATSTSIQWVDKLLLRHAAKSSLYHVTTEQNFEAIFSEPLHKLLPPELVRKIYAYHGKSRTKKGIWKDIKSSPTFLGYLWFGFTSFKNSWVVSFQNPKNHQNTGGHSIQWLQITSVHKMRPYSDRVVCINFELTTKYENGAKKITVENDDMHSFYGLLLLHEKNRKKAVCCTELTRAVEIEKARKFLVDLNFNIMPPDHSGSRQSGSHYFAH